MNYKLELNGRTYRAVDIDVDVSDPPVGSTQDPTMTVSVEGLSVVESAELRALVERWRETAGIDKSLQQYTTLKRCAGELEELLNDD